MSFKIDKQTLNDLAIFTTGRAQSVYEIFNRTHTRGGGRLLEDMFRYPLSEAEAIASRSEAIGYYMQSGETFPFRGGIFDAIEFYLGNTDTRSQLMQENNTLGRKVKNLVGSDTDYTWIHNGIVGCLEMLNTLEDFLKNISRYMEHPPMAEYVLNTRRPVPDIMAKFEKENRGVDKVQGLFVSVEDRDRALADMRDVRDVSVTGALEKNIEVNAAGVNKGTALKILGELLHIRPEDIMAFGDASNDLAMIQAVGTGVAMENGIEEVKQAADHVAPPNDADGVARFIEAYVLNEGGRVIC